MQKQLQEARAWRIPGFVVLILELALVVWLVRRPPVPGLVAAALIIVVLLAGGFFIVQPNEARAVVFLGRYAGSVRQSGFHWTYPRTVRRRISLRVRNFGSDKLKVNEASGNPVEIAAVIVWRVIDSAKALFDVEDYAAFVALQAESAIRTLAGRYPYDGTDGAVSLLDSSEVLASELSQELEARLAVAGVQIREARLTHLAYAPEIAQANIVEFDEERKATMVNNLMVVLTSDQATQPIVNTGTLYS